MIGSLPLVFPPGLNWYFNLNTKLMFNSIRALIDHDNYKPAPFEN